MLRYFFKSLYNLGVLYEYFGTFCHIILVTLGSSCSNWVAIFSYPQCFSCRLQICMVIGRFRGYLDKVLLYPQKHILCTQPKNLEKNCVQRMNFTHISKFADILFAEKEVKITDEKN